MSNQIQNPNVPSTLPPPLKLRRIKKFRRTSEKEYDLDERTAKFGEDIIKFLKLLPNNNLNYPIINQLIRSATSIGANYMEADGAESKKDFRHKIALCKKEAKESMHWLRMVKVANSSAVDECRIFWQEAHELALIFSAILKKK